MSLHRPSFYTSGPSTTQTLALSTSRIDPPDPVNPLTSSLMESNAWSRRLRKPYGECGTRCDQSLPVVYGASKYRVLTRRLVCFFGRAFNDSLRTTTPI